MSDKLPSTRIAAPKSWEQARMNPFHETDALHPADH